MNLIDMHCDTFWKLMEENECSNLRENKYCVDMKKMKHAGCIAQFFACFIFVRQFNGDYEAGYEYALSMIERAKQEFYQNNTEIALATTKQELLLNQRENKISAFLTIEEGGIIAGKHKRLETLYEQGIRLMTLLWNQENCIGFPNSKDPMIMSQGLKPFGREIVERMNELGMIIDVSHLSDGGFWDVIRLSDSPIVASHSNARELCNHPRNLSDDMIKALATRGGIAGVNFYPYFLNGQDKAGIQEIVSHIRYMLHVGGEDFVSLGTDFDGFDDANNEIAHLGEIEQLYNALKKEGITERQIEKIWSGNIMRIINDILDKKGNRH